MAASPGRPRRAAPPPRALVASLAAVLLAAAPAVAPGVAPGVAAAAAQGRAPLRARVEGLAALVGGLAPGRGVTVILRSDVSLRARLHLAGRAPEGPLPIGPLPPALLRATLDELIGETLVAREAERVRIRAPSDADVARERDRLVEEAGGEARVASLLAALGAEHAELDELARRRGLVDAFLRANLEGGSEVSDADVERAYEAGGHPFADLDLDDARDALRVWLGRRQLERAVSRWVTTLRARTPVRVLARYED
jgi:hypothetical protein